MRITGVKDLLGYPSSEGNSAGTKGAKTIWIAEEQGIKLSPKKRKKEKKRETQFTNGEDEPLLEKSNILTLLHKVTFRKSKEEYDKVCIS